MVDVLQMKLRCLLLPPAGLPKGAVLACEHCEGQEQPLLEAGATTVNFTIKPPQGVWATVKGFVAGKPSESQFTVKIQSRKQAAEGKDQGQLTEVEWVVKCSTRDGVESMAVLLPPRGDGQTDTRLREVMSSFFDNSFGLHSVAGASTAVTFLQSDFAQIAYPKGESGAFSETGPVLDLLGRSVGTIAEVMRLEESAANRLMAGTSAGVVKILPRDLQMSLLRHGPEDLVRCHRDLADATKKATLECFSAATFNEVFGDSLQGFALMLVLQRGDLARSGGWQCSDSCCAELAGALDLAVLDLAKTPGVFKALKISCPHQLAVLAAHQVMRRAKSGATTATVEFVGDPAIVSSCVLQVAAELKTHTQFYDSFLNLMQENPGGAGGARGGRSLETSPLAVLIQQLGFERAKDLFENLFGKQRVCDITVEWLSCSMDSLGDRCEFLGQNLAEDQMLCDSVLRSMVQQAAKDKVQQLAKDKLQCIKAICGAPYAERERKAHREQCEPNYAIFLQSASKEMLLHTMTQLNWDGAANAVGFVDWRRCRSQGPVEVALCIAQRWFAKNISHSLLTGISAEEHSPELFLDTDEKLFSKLCEIYDFVERIGVDLDEGKVGAGGVRGDENAVHEFRKHQRWESYMFRARSADHLETLLASKESIPLAFFRFLISDPGGNATFRAKYRSKILLPRAADVPAKYGKFVTDLDKVKQLTIALRRCKAWLDETIKDSAGDRLVAPTPVLKLSPDPRTSQA